MNIKSHLLNFFVKVPDKYRIEFDRLLYHRHIDTILILSIIIFFFEGSASFLFLRYYEETPYTVWVACVMAVYAIIYFILSRFKPNLITLKFAILEICVVFFILITGIFISIKNVEMQNIIYIIIVLMLAELFCLKPIVSTVAYASMGIMMIFVILYVNKQDYYFVFNNLIILVFVTTIAIVISNIKYKNRLKDFLNQKQVEEKTDELLHTQQQLINSEKMAALGQLVAGIAHEINTPLGAIQASITNITSYLELSLTGLPKLFQLLNPVQQTIFLNLVKRSMDKDLAISTKEERTYRRAVTATLEENNIEDAASVADVLIDMGIYSGIEELLPILKVKEGSLLLQTAYNLSGLHRNSQNINMAVERASKMVYALKSFARYDNSGEPIEADVITGIETVLTIYRNQIKQNTELVRNYKDIPKIMCYPDELNQVWTNIIHNALQAMEYKGKLEIDIFSEDEAVVVSITDSGKGIPEDIKPKIFEPFFTTKRQGEGTGLGLDIVKKIILKHKGNIQVYSIPGRTTFSVRLPIHPA